MNRVLRWYWTVQAIGWDNLPRRALQIAKKRFGYLERRLPGGAVSREFLTRQFSPEYQPEHAAQLWRARAAKFGWDARGLEFIHPRLHELVPENEWARTVTSECRELAAGNMRLFSRHLAPIGAPPQFNRDALHNVSWPVGKHWTKYDQFRPDLADLKAVWEPSRFSWAYTLAREFVRSGDSQAAQTFWQFLDAWDQQNPYGLTPQWSCGQESSFRAFAWVFAACCTLGSEAATGARLQRLTELMWYTGRHVSENIVYARSQKNNHAISEAVCLWMIGLLFPELTAAERWRAQGERVLRAEVARQIYADGSYVQHSVNYHRVMLDDLCWAACVAWAAGAPLPGWLAAPFERATQWLTDVMHAHTGLAPNYGANDGALILPLSCCDYRDFRPAVAAARSLLGKDAGFPEGPWDESALWLRPMAVAKSKQVQAGCLHHPHQRSVGKPDGGYYLFRGQNSQGMVRCHTYRDRPSQCDMLHFDLSFGGEPLLRDGGSYYYFTQEPWQSWFYSTAAHNTVEVDGQDQMIKGPRFLWLRWTQARCLTWRSSPDGSADYFRGEHYGYTRLPGKAVHERTIVRERDAYLVLDEIRGAGEPRLALRWRLRPAEWRPASAGRLNAWAAQFAGALVEIQVAAPRGAAVEILTGQEPHAEPPRQRAECRDPPEGWESLYYAEKTPAPTVVVKVPTALPARFVTLIRPADASLGVEVQGLNEIVHLRGAGPALAALLESVDERRLVSL